MNDCIFCQIINKSLPSSPVYEDESVIVIPDIHPQAPIHLLVISKRHIDEFINADDQLLSQMLTVIKKVIRDQKISDYRLVNNGRGAAVIDHLHLHILGQVNKYRKL